jgi:hypothetical protein
MVLGGVFFKAGTSDGEINEVVSSGAAKITPTLKINSIRNERYLGVVEIGSFWGVQLVRRESQNNAIVLY